MASGRRTNTRRDLPASYLALVRRFPLRPINSEAALDAATAVINELLDRHELDAAEEDYLDVLSDLVERYEDSHHAIGGVSEEEMFRFLIEQKDVTQAAVARETGIAESTISAVLAGKRTLSHSHIIALARYFHVSPRVFYGEKEALKKVARSS